jgi:hypothetical protein
MRLWKRLLIRIDLNSNLKTKFSGLFRPHGPRPPIVSPYAITGTFIRQRHYNSRFACRDVYPLTLLPAPSPYDSGIIIHDSHAGMSTHLHNFQHLHSTVNMTHNPHVEMSPHSHVHVSHHSATNPHSHVHKPCVGSGKSPSGLIDLNLWPLQENSEEVAFL